MKTKTIGILVLLLLIIATVLPVAGTVDEIESKDSEPTMLEKMQSTYEIRVLGNFLGFHIDIENTGNESESGRFNDSIDIIINTSINPPGFLLLGGTLEITIDDLPGPGGNERYLVQYLLGLGNAIVEVEATLNDVHWTSSEGNGFIFLIFVVP